MSNISMGTSIENLLASQQAAERLLQCLEKQGGEGNIVLLDHITYIIGKLSDAGRKIEENLPEYLHDMGMQHAAVRLDISVIYILPTHLDKMLSSKEPDIRRTAVRCGELSDEQMERALKDEDRMVREAAQQRVQGGGKPIIQKNPSPISLAALVRKN